MTDALRSELQRILGTVESDAVSAAMGRGGVSRRTLGSYSDPVKYAADQIERVFADAGYKLYTNPVVELTDDQSAVLMKHIVSKMLYQAPVMTGQEWYNRFAKEMGSMAKHCEGCSCDAMDAAKKVAGIE